MNHTFYLGLSEQIRLGAAGWLTQMIRAVSVDIALNLSQFSRRLTVAGIAHRVVEESGQQTIWVHSEHDVQAVKQQLAHRPPR